MPAEGRLVYWDADVLLSYIDGDAERLPTIDELLRRARAGNIELVTSVLSQAEVAFASEEKEAGQLDPAIEANIDELWKPASPITLVEVHPAIVRSARDLIRSAVAAGRSGLKPADAIHLATAERMGAVEFHTYDTGLTKHSAGVGFTIREPLVAQSQLPGTQT